MSSVRACTQTTQSGDECTNHVATAAGREWFTAGIFHRESGNYGVWTWTNYYCFFLCCMRQGQGGLATKMPKWLSRWGPSNCCYSLWIGGGGGVKGHRGQRWWVDEVLVQEMWSIPSSSPTRYSLCHQRGTAVLKHFHEYNTATLVSVQINPVESESSMLIILIISLS